MYLFMVRGWNDAWALNENGSLTLRRRESSNRRRRRLRGGAGGSRRQHRKNEQSTGWGQYLNLSSPDRESERRRRGDFIEEEENGDALR